jgi:steroid 5-alpha reductase family enzyme
MNPSDRKALIAFPVIILIALGFALAGSQHGVQFHEKPLLMLIMGLAFIIQWIVFIPSFILQTEKYFDLVGSLTYISLTLTTLFLRPEMDPRSLLLATLVCVWALRLGSFLFARIRKEGKDGRFDELKPSFFRFLNVWNIQGLWVSLTAFAALVAMTSPASSQLDGYAMVGAALWLFGFAFEVAADNQKKRFKENPENKNAFINVGLWKHSRHPNYFGEILLWLGILIIALPTLVGWQWLAVFSPVFVTLLLTKVSGIPLVEKRADDKWGGQADYEAYKQNTPVLIPKLRS